MKKGNFILALLELPTLISAVKIATLIQASESAIRKNLKELLERDTVKREESKKYRFWYVI